ncbi:hypothetical protein [Seonamhaeicola marinus]|uniref:Uncharacterized protein n=1 Tax=Seonamhaeicola marinus TaxID=1912246 RepID=A0A5D0HSA1_9FLAO|nr:hypothetical protein [Seonamhaeicola marinus]TYA74233.1 hypothetical protein FUA24_12945 [Seonamhaeicola marinus]
MVTIKDFKKRETKSGDEFFVLVLQGSVVPVKSKETNRTYFTTKTCTVASTFDEETCKQIIGQSFPGEIVKVNTEPYEYTLPESGEVIRLEHRWEYQDETLQTATENIIEDAEVM